LIRDSWLCPTASRGRKNRKRIIFFIGRGSLNFVEKVTGKRSSQTKITAYSLGIFF
jgi:hypothetical protein